MLRAETQHSINGASGRMGNLHKPPAPWLDTVFANQSWFSEARSIKGYGPGAKMRVTIRFDDQCKNGHNTFSITADVTTPESLRRREIAAGGCLHEEIAAVFPELTHLIKWHLVSTDGPMHYPSNVIYHARQHGATHAWVYYTGKGNTDPLGIVEGATKERLLGHIKASEALKAEGQPGYRIQWDDKTAKVRNLNHARSCAAWPDATDEQLTAPDLEAVLVARLPALLKSFRADMETAGFAWGLMDI